MPFIARFCDSHHLCDIDRDGAALGCIELDADNADVEGDGTALRSSGCALVGCMLAKGAFA